MIMSEEINLGRKRNFEEHEESEIKCRKSKKQSFLYGNYSRYYGYRIKEGCDPRIRIFEGHRHLLEAKDILDIGCNDGSLTLEVTKRFNPKSMTGIDIDKTLISKAKHNLKHFINNSDTLGNLLNVSFEHGNYVLSKEAIIEDECEKFDTILCLSVTKWIQLNFGDNGLQLAFKRMYKQLRSNGILILEAQTFKSYGRRKGLSENVYNNYKNIKFYPKDFESYLLGPEVGFSQAYFLSEPNTYKGFDRPIQVFVKGINYE